MTKFLQAAPPTSSEGDFDATVRAWLVEGGIAVEAGHGPSCSIVALLVDEDADVSIFALPDELLDEAAHRDLAKVSGAGFEWFFNADLAPEQFAGAFRICSGSSTEPDVFQDQVETLREEMDDEAPDMDWDTLIENAGAWNEYKLSSGGTLPGPVSHCYTARLSM